MAQQRVRTTAVLTEAWSKRNHFGAASHPSSVPLQSTKFIDAVNALPATTPSGAPADTLPALGAALMAITPLSGQAAQCSAISAALAALQSAQGSPVLNKTADDIAK